MMEITDKNQNRIPEDTSQGNIPNPGAFQSNANRDTTYAKTMLKELLRFDVRHQTEKDLREHISRLHCLLRKVVLLLLEKSSLCKNLEEQRTVLTLQCSSLKNLVAVTKDLLAARNTEVDKLYKNIKTMEERINLEKDRQNMNILNTLSESAKLNEDIKAQYNCQIDMFNELRARYEEKVALLVAENMQLSLLFEEQTTNIGRTREDSLCDTPEHQRRPDEGSTDLARHLSDRTSLCEILTNEEQNIVPNVISIDQHYNLCSENIADTVIEGQMGYGEGELHVGVIMKLEGDNEEKIATSETGIIDTVKEKQKGYGEGELHVGVIMKLESDNEEKIATLETGIIDTVIEGQKGYGEGELQVGVTMKLEGDNEKKIATSETGIIDTVKEKQKGYGEGGNQVGVVMKLEGDNEEKISTSETEIIRSQDVPEIVMGWDIAEQTWQGEGEMSCLSPVI